jgi:HD-like signal output (HDOD) protein
VIAPQATIPSRDRVGDRDGGHAALLRGRLAERLAAPDLALPVLPESAAQVLAATHDADVDARQLVALLDRDPVLASHVLRMANSPAYATRASIVSLRQAVTHLGVRCIADLALAASLRASIFSDARHATALRAIWRHSATTAGFAREGARLLRAPVELAFLCGLLHSIGKPFVLRLAVDVSTDAGIALEGAEVMALVEELHAGAGRLLAESWRLPGPVAAAIESCAHYSRGEAVEPMIAALAAHLATFALGSGIEADAAAAHPAVADLNLYPEDLAQLAEKAEAVLAVVEACEP